VRVKAVIPLRARSRLRRSFCDVPDRYKRQIAAAVYVLIRGAGWSLPMPVQRSSFSAAFACHRERAILAALAKGRT
jgi:hypothetical protein